MPEEQVATKDQETEESQTSETSEEVVEEQTSKEGEEVEGEKETLTRKEAKTVPIARFNEVWGQMRRLERLTSQLLEERKGREVVEKKPEPEPDYDSMTPKDLVTHLEKRVASIVTDTLGRTIGPMQEQSQLKAAQDSIEKAATKHPDFWDFKQEMIDISNAHPTLDAESVYLLASGSKGAAGDRILNRLKDKVDQKKRALTEKRSSAGSRTTKERAFPNVREGALAAAKELGYDV